MQDAGVLALTLDLPCTFDFCCNARALAALVGSLRAGGTFGAPVNRVVLVGFSAGGLSSLLAADIPGVVGFVGLDPFDRTMSGETERLGAWALGLGGGRPAAYRGAAAARTAVALQRRSRGRALGHRVASVVARRVDRGRVAL